MLFMFLCLNYSIHMCSKSWYDKFFKCMIYLGVYIYIYIYTHIYISYLMSPQERKIDWCTPNQHKMKHISPSLNT